MQIIDGGAFEQCDTSHFIDDFLVPLERYVRLMLVQCDFGEFGPVCLVEFSGIQWILLDEHRVEKLDVNVKNCVWNEDFQSV